MFQLVQLMVFLGPIGMQLVPLYRCNLWYFWTPLVRSWCHYTGATYGISGPHWYAAGATIQVKHMVFLDPIVMQLVSLLRCNIWYFWTLLVCSWCHYTGTTYGISGLHWYAAGVTIKVKQSYFLTLLLCSWCRYIGATYGISGLHWYAAGATIQVQHMVFLDPIGTQLVPLFR